MMPVGYGCIALHGWALSRLGTLDWSFLEGLGGHFIVCIAGVLGRIRCNYELQVLRSWTMLNTSGFHYICILIVVHMPLLYTA